MSMPLLKCRYVEGMFSNEYIIQFKVAVPTSESWMIVDKNEVIKLEGNEGLVKLIELQTVGNKCLVGLNDAGDRRISRRYVPKEEIVVQ